jgi:hypothetical protein
VGSAVVISGIWSLVNLTKCCGHKACECIDIAVHDIQWTWHCA